MPSCSCCGHVGSSTAHCRSPATAAANAAAKCSEFSSDSTVTAAVPGTRPGGRVPQLFPAQALPGHDDGGPVGAVIGPALESVEERHQTNFTGREPPESRDAIL